MEFEWGYDSHHTVPPHVWCRVQPWTGSIKHRFVATPIGRCRGIPSKSPDVPRSNEYERIIVPYGRISATYLGVRPCQSPRELAGQARLIGTIPKRPKFDPPTIMTPHIGHPHLSAKAITIPTKMCDWPKCGVMMLCTLIKGHIVLDLTTIHFCSFATIEAFKLSDDAVARAPQPAEVLYSVIMSYYLEA